jgi:hypothetical protein
MPAHPPLEIDLDMSDFNPHQYNHGVAQAEGIVIGRRLMKEEVLRLINAAYPTPTKATKIITDLIEGIQIETDSLFSLSAR